MSRDNAGARLLARFELEGELGSGAEGAVYRARERASGRVVAIKTVPLHGRESGTAGERRRNPYVDSLSRLAHENIAAIHEIVITPVLAYVVMELVNAPDLRSHAECGKLLPLAETLSVVARVADALACAHENGVVHGDLKPANILYDAKSDSVKLTDFQVAETASGHRMPPGTIAYMSPERLCGRLGDAASDQFSLAVTLYTLACGRLPFCRHALPQLVFGIVHEPHTDIRAHDRALPPALSAVLDRALQKRPERRYGNAGELALALRAVAAREDASRMAAA